MSKKILVIAAHPDDEVYGMGGTIARLSQTNEVHTLIVTDGSTAQYRDEKNIAQILENKKQEALAANKLLGVQSVIFGTLPDMMLDQTPHIHINKLIEDTINSIKPHAVYTHFWGDVNLDHQRVYQSTLVAARPTAGCSVKELYCYRVPSSTEWAPSVPTVVFTPNVFVDISAYTKQKHQAIAAYSTELRAFPHPRSEGYIQNFDQATGLKVGLSAAEEFILLRKLC